MGVGAGPEAPTKAWSELGAGAEVVVDAVEVRLVELGFRTPVRTSRGVHRSRPVVLVRIMGSDERGSVDGWGECAALADTTYDSEDSAAAFTSLVHALVPALVELGGSRSRLPAVAELGAIGAVAPESRLAFAALEMAVADAHLRSSETSLISLLGVGADPVAIGAVVGQFDDIDALVACVGDVVDQGYSRVKMKIGPGWDVEPVAVVSREFAGLILQVDANESYSPAHIAHIDALEALDRFGLACIEQPFPRADLAAHAELARRVATRICLDESLDSPQRVAQALSMGACSAVCVKPGRLGGVGAALETVRVGTDAGVPLWMGGMFESGYARGVNAALAAMPGFAWPGDLSPARSYLVDDLVLSPAPLVRVPPGGALGVRLCVEPGMGPEPDRTVVDRLTTRSVRLGG